VYDVSGANLRPVAKKHVNKANRNRGRPVIASAVSLRAIAVLRLPRFFTRQRVHVKFFFRWKGSPRFPLKIHRSVLGDLSNVHRGDGKRYVVRAE